MSTAKPPNSSGIAFNSSWLWGYAIYRTVYTPESDELWNSALDKLDRWMNYRIDAELRIHKEWAQDPYPERVIHESYRNVIIEDKDLLDGASVDRIRQHFKKWKETITGEPGEVHFGICSMGRFNACLMVDDRSLKSIVNGIEPGEREFGDPVGYCTMVDPAYNWVIL